MSAEVRPDGPARSGGPAALGRAVFTRVVRPTQLALRRAVSTAVDRRAGIVTTDEAVAAHLRRDVAVYRRTWRALGWSGVARLLRKLAPSPDDVLLDIGCGAGRILCAAARQPFRRVVGVELDPEFAALASSNIERLRGRRCPGEVVETDATTYVVPDDVTIVFLYNPFRGETLDRTLEQVLASYDRVPRRVRLVYANPVEDERVLAGGRFRPTDELRLSWRPGGEWARSQRVAFYEVQPA